MTRSRATVSVLTTLLVMIALSGTGHAQGTAIQDQPGTKTTKLFMQLKLEPAKQILEGIALEDFEKIQSSAQRMRNLTLDEKWMTIQTPEYQDLSKDFQRAINKVSESAKARNIDGVTLGYVQMTLYCVQCHRSLRK